MGFYPHFFIGQGPGGFDAHKVVMPHGRQIIAQYHEQSDNTHGDEAVDVDGVTQAEADDGQVKQEKENS